MTHHTVAPLIYFVVLSFANAAFANSKSRLILRKAAGATSNTTVAATPFDNMTSREAADAATESAELANKVAVHSINITDHAQSALKRARGVLRDARSDAQGLSGGQQKLLKDAEAHLHVAGQVAEYGKLKQAVYTEARGHWKHSMNVTRIGRLEETIASSDGVMSELGSMRAELKDLGEDLNRRRAIIHSHGGASDGVTSGDEIDVRMQGLENKLTKLEKEEKDGHQHAEGSASHDELKADIERVRNMLESLEERDVVLFVGEKEAMEVRLKLLGELKEIKERMQQIPEQLNVTSDAEARAALEKELAQLQDRLKVIEEQMGFRPESPKQLTTEIERLHNDLGKLTTVIPEKVVHTGNFTYSIPRRTLPVTFPMRELAGF